MLWNLDNTCLVQKVEQLTSQWLPAGCVLAPHPQTSRTPNVLGKCQVTVLSVAGKGSKTADLLFVYFLNSWSFPALPYGVWDHWNLPYREHRGISSFTLPTVMEHENSSGMPSSMLDYKPRLIHLYSLLAMWRSIILVTGNWTSCDFLKIPSSQCNMPWLGHA